MTRRILIIRFSAMGDVAMTVPVVQSLAEQYPDLDITVVSRPFAQAFFSEDIIGSHASRIHFIGINPKAPEFSGVLGLERLYRRLSAAHYDFVADFHGVLRTHYLRLRFRLAGIPVAVIDKHRRERRALVAPEAKKVRHQLPSPFSNYADVLASLGLPLKTISFRPLPSAGKTSAIGIAPFAAHAGKILPIETMEQLIRLLIGNDSSRRIILFGRGKQEDEVFGRWTATYPQCVRATELAQNLGEELQLMRSLHCMVSMDSANMHLASLVGTRVISIWGATDPLAGFMGYGQSTSDAVQLDLPCRPCSIYGNKPCSRGDYACLRGIKAEKIFDFVT